MDNHETLMRLAQQVRTAITEGENTAEKVGRVLTGILEKIEIEELARVFLRKDQDDETAFLVKFFNGIETGEYIQGESGACINEKGDAELRSLIARIKAVATELEVTDKATTLNLLVKNLAEIHNLDVDNLATLFRTVIKDYVRSENFVSGFAGEGMKLEKALSGDWEMELDRLTIRKTLRVFELLISKIRAVNGGLVVSPANGKIKEVTEPEDEPGLYRLTIDGDTHFVPGDLVRCQVFTGNQLKHYWVPVKRVNEDSIFVARADFPEDAYPEAGDEIVLMGNISDTTRQGCLFLSATDDGKPRIQVLNGINSPSLAGKNKTIIGCLDGIEDTYFKEDQPQGYGLYSDNAYLKGDFILKNSGESVESYIKATEDNIRLTVKEIQVGGRNLLPHTNMGRKGWNINRAGGKQELSDTDVLGTKAVKFTITEVSPSYLVLYKTINREVLKSNTQYTISMDIFSTYDTDLYISVRETNATNLLAEWPPAKISSGKWNKISLTTTSNNNDTLNQVLYVFGFPQTGEFTIANVKLEEGNKPTDWTPAPEDMEERMSQAEISLFPDNIKMSVVERINNVEIGGRNLIKNSEFEQTINGYNGIHYWFTKPLAIGQNYILSFSSHKLIGGAVHVYLTDTRGGVPRQYFISSDGHAYNAKALSVCTITADKEWKGLTFYQEVGNDPEEHIFSISHVKIEKGNKPTDWTPAPEDQASKTELLDTGIDITSKQVTLTADRTVIQSREGRSMALFTTDDNGNPKIETELIDANKIITQDLLADKIKATDIETGKLKVLSGSQMGGFYIYDNKITSNPNDLIYIGNKYTSLEKGHLTIMYGDNFNFPVPHMYHTDLRLGSNGGNDPLASFEVSSSGGKQFHHEIKALTVSASGASENYAIQMQSGYLSGLCLKTRRLGISATLEHDDVIVVCHNDSANITITLPLNPQIGKIIFIKRQSQNTEVFIHPNGKTALYNSNAHTTSIGIGGHYTCMCFYDGIYWHISRSAWL